jgi:hypothetical protein
MFVRQVYFLLKSFSITDARVGQNAILLLAQVTLPFPRSVFTEKTEFVFVVPDILPITPRVGTVFKVLFSQTGGAFLVLEKFFQGNHFNGEITLGPK